MKENIVIGIEGLVGAGKTSLCRELLSLIPNSIILHGGNLYRGIVIAIMNSGIDLKSMLAAQNEKIDIKKIMDMLQVSIKIENSESVVYVGNKKIEEEKLQSDEASMAVSNVALKADNSKLYSFAKGLINNFKKQFNVIVSGRDLMAIYPDLDYHFFIVADLEERVQRKAKQYENSAINLIELKKHIEKRDELQEKAGYYRRYSNTIDIDITKCKNAKESAEKVYTYIK